MAEEDKKSQKARPKGKSQKKVSLDDDHSNLEDVKGYDAEELMEEIGNSGPEDEEKSPEKLLLEIRKERKQLEEERARLNAEKELEKSKPEEEEKKEIIVETEPEEEDKPVKSFAKERRKRKHLERTKSYLFAGEYVLLIILALTLLYSEGISFDPAFLPIENTLYLIIIFLLIMKGEKLYFRNLNMRYSGTLHRKSIGVDHYKGIEVPPMIFMGFVFAVFIIPQTHDFISKLVEVLSFNDTIPFSSNFIFNLTILILASLVMSIIWIVYLMWYKSYVLTPELKKISEPFVIEDVFLITHSGLLIRHVTRELKPGVDDDILTGMLTAVKDFVKDSFRANEEGELDELQYGKLRIIIEYGRDVYLATVIRGQETMHLRPEMKRVIRRVHRKYGRILHAWDGNLSNLRGVENLMNHLVQEV